MSFDKIDIAYQHTDEDLRILNVNYPIATTDWNKNQYAPIKEKIKKHLRRQQEDLCCYCKNRLGHDLKEVDIEHIVPKSRYVQFMFEPKNLALSCPSCNTKKSTKDVLIHSIEEYPNGHEQFSIVHPHFSKYSDHIEWFEGIIYIGKDERGNNTIKMCDLNRKGLIKNNAITSKLLPNPLEQYVETIRNSDDDIVINEAIAKIEQAVGK